MARRFCDVGDDLSWRLLLELHEPSVRIRPFLVVVVSPCNPQKMPQEKLLLKMFGVPHGSESGSDDRLPELFLAELDRAAMLYPKLEASLEESTPCNTELNTIEAHRFLVEFLAFA